MTILIVYLGEIGKHETFFLQDITITSLLHASDEKDNGLVRTEKTESTLIASKVNNSSKANQKLSQFGSIFFVYSKWKSLQTLTPTICANISYQSIIYCARISGSNSLTTLNVNVLRVESLWSGHFLQLSHYLWMRNFLLFI